MGPAVAEEPWPSSCGWCLLRPLAFLFVNFIAELPLQRTRIWSQSIADCLFVSCFILTWGTWTETSMFIHTNNFKTTKNWVKYKKCKLLTFEPAFCLYSLNYLCTIQQFHGSLYCTCLIHTYLLFLIQKYKMGLQRPNLLKNKETSQEASYVQKKQNQKNKHPNNE